MIYLLLFHAFAFLLITSCGFAFSQLLIIKDLPQIKFRFFDYFWLGLFSLTIVGQISSFLLPSGLLVFVLISACIAVFPLILYQSKIIEGARNLIVELKNGGKTTFIYLCLGFSVYFLVCLYSLRPVIHYDTQLYHFNMVRWNHDYPIVPGLANLHGRLGFNSSFHLLAAFLEADIESGISVRTTLSLLYVAALWQFLYLLFFSSRRIVTAYSLSTLLFLAYSILELPSFSTDLAMSIIVLVAGYYVLSNLYSHNMLAIFLAALAVTFKLSAAAVFPLFAIPLFSGSMRKEIDGIELRQIVKRLLIPGILIILLFSGMALRNAIISGYFLFPVTQTRLPLDWSVPHSSAQQEKDIVRAWARSPGVGSMQRFRDPNHNWFKPWLKRSIEVYFIYFVVLGITLMLWLMILIRKVAYRKIGNGHAFPGFNLLILNAIALCGLAFAMYSAPDLRFSGVYVWILFASSMPVALSCFKIKTIRITGAIVLFGLTMTAWRIVLRIGGKKLIAKNVLTIPPTIKKSVRAVRSVSVDGGTFDYYVPVKGDKCGNSRLPCTPYPSGSFAQRDSSRLGKGFQYVGREK